jgi:hypothetical protein
MIALFALLLVGICIQLFIREQPTKDGHKGPARTALWSYGIILLSVIGLMFSSFATTTKYARLMTNTGSINSSSATSIATQSVYNTFGFIKELFVHSTPMLLMTGILVWLLTLVSTHYTKINQGRVAGEYSTYAFLSLVFIAIQSGYMFKQMMDTKYTMKQQPSPSNLVHYMMTLGNVMLVGIMTIILTYFSTDG